MNAGTAGLAVWGQGWPPVRGEPVDPQTGGSTRSVTARTRWADRTPNFSSSRTTNSQDLNLRGSELIEPISDDMRLFTSSRCGIERRCARTPPLSRCLSFLRRSGHRRGLVSELPMRHSAHPILGLVGYLQPHQSIMHGGAIRGQLAQGRGQAGR